MPHFDENGIGTWICQICAGIRNDMVESVRMKIPGRDFEGNVCPSCVSKLNLETKTEPEKDPNPHIYGFHTRLSNAYTIGRDGVRCPPWAGEKTSHAYRAWKRGHDEFERQKDMIDPMDYADNPAELEVQRELKRTGISNLPAPRYCPDCFAEVTKSEGMVGETVLVCAEHGIVWEDSEDAVRRVF